MDASAFAQISVWILNGVKVLQDWIITVDDLWKLCHVQHTVGYLSMLVSLNQTVLILIFFSELCKFSRTHARFQNPYARLEHWKNLRSFSLGPEAGY